MQTRGVHRQLDPRRLVRPQGDLRHESRARRDRRRARPRASGHESQDVTRAEESLEVLQQRLEDTKREVEAEVARLETTLDATTISLRAVEVPARKSDIAVGEVALVWAPWRKGADGFPAPAYD